MKRGFSTGTTETLRRLGARGAGQVPPLHDDVVRELGPELSGPGFDRDADPRM